MQAVEGAHGKDDLVVVGVLAAAKGLLLLVEHADHGVEAGFYIDLLADGVLAVDKEQFRGIVSEDADRRMALVLLVGKHAPGLHSEIRYIRDLGRVAIQNGACYLVALILCAHVAHAELLGVAVAAVDRHHVGKRAQRVNIVHGQLLARELLGGWADTDDRHVEDPEDIRSQRIGEVGDPVVESVDDRGNDNHRGDADDDAEDGEAGAQLVVAQRIERHLDGFAGLSLSHGAPS